MRGRMHMLYRNIEQFITQFPIYQYEFIDTNEIEFDNKVRTFCKKDCPHYGKSWSCPPAIRNIDKCKEKCLKYPKALLFSSITEEANNAREITNDKRKHDQLVKQIANFMKVNNVPYYALSSDECTLCEKCSYPKKPCMRPEVMLPCVESHGIVLIDLMEKHQMDYLLEDNMKIWVGIIFLEEE